ncbi:MAG: acyl-CoA thioesterase [Planctomycetes bacterium]|nr:acyl-CoA thioesterase [Planctomycetota bacterium]
MGERISRHETQVRVRYAETDAMGFLHHARYFIYFEEGRIDLLRQCGLSYREMEERGLYYVVVTLQCRYRLPARYDDVLTLRTTTERLTRVRIDHRYELLRDGMLLADAVSTIACIDAQGKPTGLPDDLWTIMTGESQ